MKKSNMLLVSMLGMGTGAFLYSYCQKHPLKVQMAKNKMKNMMKDYK